jgi:large subunit ribosomal protein L15
MKLHELKPAAGATRNTKRVGRGQGTGRGGTSTRGHKGAQSRRGYSSKEGFEGGQMPLKRRLPKFGFKNPFRVEYKVVNLEQLELLAAHKGITTFDHAVFEANGLISSTNYLVKVLGRGELKSKITVSANKFSSTAQAAIEQAGGTVNVVASKAAPKADSAE